MKDKEVWIDIPQYKGYYQISNLGAVKSLKFNKVKFINPSTTKAGYKVLRLFLNGNRKMFSLHQLIAISFLNHKPKGMEIVVDHIDGDKSNNILSNLQLISHRENCSKQIRDMSSNYVGVHWSKSSKKWASQITINKKRTHLGYFDNEIDASITYNNKLKELGL